MLPEEIYVSGDSRNKFTCTALEKEEAALPVRKEKSDAPEDESASATENNAAFRTFNRAA